MYVARARANSSFSAMRPRCYYLLEEIVILGVIYGSLLWSVCNPAAPAGPRGIPGVSPGGRRAAVFEARDAPTRIPTDAYPQKTLQPTLV